MTARWRPPISTSATRSSPEDHPFWNVTDHAWQPAEQLDVGDQLLTAEGHTAEVQAYRDTGQSGDAYNFTVAVLHTYYVEAGDNTLCSSTTPATPA